MLNESDREHFCGSLSTLAEHFYEVSESKGFHEDDSREGRFAEFIANLHGEVSELWEAYRRGKLNEQCDKQCPLTCAEEELADIVIRAFDTAHSLGIDIGRAVAEKDAYNQTRPYKHGKVC